MSLAVPDASFSIASNFPLATSTLAAGRARGVGRSEEPGCRGAGDAAITTSSSTLSSRCVVHSATAATAIAVTTRVPRNGSLSSGRFRTMKRSAIAAMRNQAAP